MQSIWQSNVKMPDFPSLNKDVKTDVLIIGGGIAGILTAYFLKENGIDCVVCEKERICGNTTQNTTAKITYQHGLIYSKIAKEFSLDTAKLYLQANKAAFDKYADLCADIDCDYEIKDNYVYSRDNRQALEEELSILKNIYYDAEFCENIPLPFQTQGAIKFKNQAQFNPLKFLSGIAKKLNIYENTFIRETGKNTAITDKAKIEAENIIVATRFPIINKHGFYYLKLYQHRSYMLALENAQNVNGMYVDESKTGMTFRNYKNYLILGGGGHRTGKDGGNWKELEAFASIHYPSADIKYMWAAQDCISLDGMPYIGRYSAKTNNLFVASGFNKWGMTGSMLSAMILSDMIAGKENEYAEIFNPSRSILRPQLALNGFEAVKNLLTVSKKRCPHLGCALKWNAAEHSYDCPCHGSRFSQSGKVLNNPANGDLKM